MKGEPQNVNDQSYTNREIWLQIENFINNSNEQHKALDTKIDEIIKAQKYTNGNVMDLLLWRATTKGQFYIIPLIVAAIISGVVGLMFKEFF